METCKYSVRRQLLFSRHAHTQNRSPLTFARRGRGLDIVRHLALSSRRTTCRSKNSTDKCNPLAAI